MYEIYCVDLAIDSNAQQKSEYRNFDERKGQTFLKQYEMDVQHQQTPVAHFN